MPKVLLLAPRYFGVGGAERYTRQFARAASDALGPHSVTVWSYLTGEASDGAGPRYAGAAASRSSLVGKARFVAGSLRLGRGHQLIVAAHVGVAPVARWLARVYGMPYVILAYGIDVWGPLAARKRAALSGAERVVAISRFTATRLRKQGVSPERITVVPPVVDPQLLAQSQPGTAPSLRPLRRLLTVARLIAVEGYKGCDTVIEALPGIREPARPLEYTIVGDGDDRPRLQRLARELGVGEMVRFAGSVSDSDLPVHYASSDLFVMPSRSGCRAGRWQGEGFGLVFIEAAAFSLPAIAGRGDGAEEAVQDGVTGFVVDGGDVRAVAGAVRTLLSDEALRNQMGAAARARVLREFTYPRMQEQVRDLLAGLTGVPT